MSGKPRPEALEQRLEKFFRENPHEELSLPDMMAKFGATESSVNCALKRLKSSGLPLNRISVYRLMSEERAP